MKHLHLISLHFLTSVGKKKAIINQKVQESGVNSFMRPAPNTR